MKGTSALKKITARARKLKKKFPGKQWKTLVKQAGSDYRKGKLKPKRKKAAPKKRKAVRKRRVSSVMVARVGRVKRRAKRRKAAKPKVTIRYRTRTKTVRVGRRVGKKSIMPILLLLGGAGLAAYMLLRPKTPVIIQTGNASRDNLASNIMTYATAAKMTAEAIADLIAKINAANQSGNDAAMQQLYDNVKNLPASNSSMARVMY